MYDSESGTEVLGLRRGVSEYGGRDAEGVDEQVGRGASGWARLGPTGTVPPIEEPRSDLRAPEADCNGYSTVSVVSDGC